MKKKIVALTIFGVLALGGSAFADTYEVPGVGSITVEQEGTGGSVTIADQDGNVNIELDLGVTEE